MLQVYPSIIDSKNTESIFIRFFAKYFVLFRWDKVYSHLNPSIASLLPPSKQGF